MTDDVLHCEFFAVDDLPDGVDLVGVIREFNSHDLDVPWMWSVGVDTEDVTDPNAITLDIGVRGAVGALHWMTGGGVDLVPAKGVNNAEVMYRIAGLHDSYMPVGSELPVDEVYAALAEFLATRQLPTCVGWRRVSA